MADRSWNAIDGALYEEEWSQAAKLIAGVLLARCPNQYGVFKMPFWFLRVTFSGIYNRSDIDGVIAEWEGDGWITYFPETGTIWIRNKWGRCEPNPGENNIKGAMNHLKQFPEVLKGFEDRYRVVLNSRTPVEPPSNPRSTPDPDPDPDPELLIKDLPSKSDGECQSEKSEKKKYIPIEDREAKTPNSKLIRYWHRLFRQVYEAGYVGDIKKMFGQMKIALRKNEYETIKDAMEYLFALKQDQYIRHDFDHFIRKLSHYIIEKDRPEKK